jgi:hypothetical protein
VLNTTISRVSTYVDNNTWSTPSSDENYDGNDPTTILKCKECKARVPYADMIRKICHQICNDWEMRFSHATPHAIVQCEIIIIKISRDDIADIFQCKVCKRWDTPFRVERILCHDTCNICREFQFNSEAEHRKYCYTPVHCIKSHITITEHVLRFPPCDQLTSN